jgi:hypothetical protein
MRQTPGLLVFLIAYYIPRRPSSLHGLGLFATCRLHFGDIILIEDPVLVGDGRLLCAHPELREDEPVDEAESGLNREEILARRVRIAAAGIDEAFDQLDPVAQVCMFKHIR